MTSMLTKVGFLLLLLSNAGDKASASSDTFNLDTHLEESFECFWHIGCSTKMIALVIRLSKHRMNKVPTSEDGMLRIKKAADRMLDPQIVFLLEDVFPHLEKKFRLISSIAEGRSTDAWMNNKKKTCAFSKEVRNKLLVDVYTPFVQHYTEICFDEKRLLQCEAVTEATKVYLELEAEMKARGECKITTLKYAFP